MASRYRIIIISAAASVILEAASTRAENDPISAPFLPIDQQQPFKTHLTDWNVYDPSDLPSIGQTGSYYATEDMIPEHSMVPLPPAMMGAASLGFAWLVRRGYKQAMKIKKNRSRFI